MLDLPSARASIEQLRSRFGGPLDAVALDAWGVELASLGADVARAIEAELSTLVEPPNAA